MGEFYGIFLLPGPAILCWQAFQWLREGHWTPLPVSKLFTYNDIPLPHVSWLGAQKIIDWLLDIPLSFVAFILGVLMVVVLVVVEELVRKARSDDATWNSP